MDLRKFKSKARKKAIKNPIFYSFHLLFFIVLAYMISPQKLDANLALQKIHNKVFEAEGRTRCRNCHHLFKPGYVLPPGVKPRTMRCGNCHVRTSKKITSYSALGPMNKVLHKKCKTCHEKYFRTEIANKYIGKLTKGNCKVCH